MLGALSLARSGQCASPEASVFQGTGIVRAIVACVLTGIAVPIGLLVLWAAWSLLSIVFEPPLSKAFRSTISQMKLRVWEVRGPPIADLVGLPVERALEVLEDNRFACRHDGSALECRRSIGRVVCGELWQVRLEASLETVTAARATKEVTCI